MSESINPAHATAPPERRFPVLWPELVTASDTVRQWHERTYMLPQPGWHDALSAAIERMDDDERVTLAALQNVTASRGIICIDGFRPNEMRQSLTVQADFPRDVDVANHMGAWYDAHGRCSLRLISIQMAKEYPDLRAWGVDVSRSVSRSLPLDVGKFAEVVSDLHELQPRLGAWERLNADGKPRPRPFFLCG